MSSKGLHYLFYFLFFLNFTYLNAQDVQKEKQDLASILTFLEDLYEVRFSYADEVVKTIKLKLPERDLTLTDILNFISAETNLNFQLLDNRFIVITEKNSDSTNNDFDTQRLEEVVVVNYLTTGLNQLNDGTTRIKPETFGILPGLIEPDVLQTIQALPGILSIDETVSNINVRGGTHDQNLILWDGIKMYQSGHFFGLISAFNPYTTTSVNVSKNGTSAKYGEGLSSVIDMRLSNTIGNEFKAGGGFNLINGDVYAKIPTSKNTEIQLSARRSLTDLILTPTYDQYFKRVFEDSDFNQKSETTITNNEKFSFYDFTVKFLYDITSKDRLQLNFLSVNNSLDYEERSTINDRSEALNSSLLQENLATGLTYIRDWSDKLQTTVLLYLSNYDLDATNFDIINDQRLIQENEVYDGSLRLDINYSLNQNLKINTGYQFTEVGISNLEDVNNPEFRSYIKEVVRSNSGYVESDFLSNNGNTRLKLGTRINYFDKFNKILVEPRLSFSQRFLNNFRFEVLGEFKSQTTSQIIDLQNDFLGIEKRRWVLSNDSNVPVLKSKQASVGLHYNKNKFLLSAEGYIKKVDGITSRSQGFQNQFQFVNDIGSYEIKGVDVLINKQFQNLFSTWLSYSFSKNDYTFNNLNSGISFPNNANITHAITFGGVYTQNKLKLAIGFNWHSGRPFTDYIDVNDSAAAREINYESPNSSNLGDYMRADCSATYAFNISDGLQAHLGASVWNVLDKKNVINIYHTLDDDNNINTIENQSLGITPNLSFRIDF